MRKTPVDEDFISRYGVLLPWLGTQEDLDRRIESLTKGLEDFQPIKDNEALTLSNYMSLKRGLATAILQKRAYTNGYAREATSVSEMVSSSFQPREDDSHLLLENPVIWMANAYPENVAPLPPTGNPILDRARKRADAIRAALTSPPIDQWTKALRAKYGRILDLNQTAPQPVHFYKDERERNLRTTMTAYNIHPHGHRASILLDLDWHSGLSTAYFVVASKAALAYLQYKSPLDLHNLHTDPIWNALSFYLPCHTEIWPLPIQPVTFGRIGTYPTEYKRHSKAVQASAIDTLRMLSNQQIEFEMPEIEYRFIRNHSPNWDYQIPKVFFTPENLHYLDRALQWNSDRVRLTRDRLGTRGTIPGTRVQLRPYGEQVEDGEEREIIIPTDEVIPTKMVDGTDLLPFNEVCPTIAQAATNHPKKVIPGKVWLI